MKNISVGDFVVSVNKGIVYEVNELHGDRVHASYKCNMDTSYVPEASGTYLLLVDDLVKISPSDPLTLLGELVFRAQQTSAALSLHLFPNKRAS